MSSPPLAVAAVALAAPADAVGPGRRPAAGQRAPALPRPVRRALGSVRAAIAGRHRIGVWRLRRQRRRGVVGRAGAATPGCSAAAPTGGPTPGLITPWRNRGNAFRSAAAAPRSCHYRDADESSDVRPTSSAMLHMDARLTRSTTLGLSQSAVVHAQLQPTSSRRSGLQDVGQDFIVVPESG